MRERTGLSIGALHCSKTGAKNVTSRQGAATALPATVEAQLATIMLHVAGTGMGLLRPKISQIVWRVAAQLGHPRPDLVAGASWMSAFLVCNPTSPSAMGNARAARGS